jgi:hypothetical protein
MELSKGNSDTLPMIIWQQTERVGSMPKSLLQVQQPQAVQPSDRETHHHETLHQSGKSRANVQDGASSTSTFSAKHILICQHLFVSICLSAFVC